MYPVYGEKSRTWERDYRYIYNFAFILVKPTDAFYLEPHSIKISLFTIFEPAILEKDMLRSFCLWWLDLQGCLVPRVRRRNRAWSKNLKRLCSSWLSPHRLPDIPQTWARTECKPGDVCQYQDSRREKGEIGRLVSGRVWNQGHRYWGVWHSSSLNLFLKKTTELRHETLRNHSLGSWWFLGFGVWRGESARTREGGGESREKVKRFLPCFQPHTHTHFLPPPRNVPDPKIQLATVTTERPGLRWQGKGYDEYWFVRVPYTYY